MSGKILRGPVPSSIIRIPFPPITRYVLLFVVPNMFIPEKLHIGIAACDHRLELEEFRDLRRIAALIDHTNQSKTACYHAPV